MPEKRWFKKWHTLADHGIHNYDHLRYYTVNGALMVLQTWLAWFLAWRGGERTTCCPLYFHMHNYKVQPCGYCYDVQVYTIMTLFIEVFVCAICILILPLAKWSFTCGSIHVSWHQTMVCSVNCAGNASISWRACSRMQH